MPNTKNNNRKTSTANTSTQSGKRNSGKGKGITPGAMPDIPSGRERAKDIDNTRRGNAQTFEL